MTDTPKLWRDMTPEEKGALLLARHEGKVIEYYSHHLFRGWAKVASFGPRWDDHAAYRIRPEPVRETVTFIGRIEHGFDRSGWGEDSDTHCITLPVIDGSIPAGAYTSEDGHTITVEALDD